ncbi:MAG: UDP-N-acetylglucosamine 2-epimerase (non-hydrolyzing) [Gemmatimonadales bacterium]|nr:UDP-N-acetylglucosamine 2-epimerase (non-hydrolyzing) [Gemmatimonadales bacterium]
MKVLSVVGARPQLIKAAVVSERLRVAHHDVLVHTGQHYDVEMSDVFFEQLGLPVPDHHLGVGSGTHGWQTGRMLEQLESVMLTERPDVAVVYGDTNSTLAGALAAAKLHIPVAHVEAGLRSFNRRMPEEINRVLTDHVSDWLFCPTRRSTELLESEGITRGVHLVGDVMFDLLLAVEHRLPSADDLLNSLQIEPGGYHLATVHRAENTDSVNRLAAILDGLQRLDLPTVFPVHPRTRQAIEAAGLDDRLRNGAIVACLPVGYLEMIQLQRHARSIITDSGGVQKEAYLLGVPCVTVRDETEWEETLDGGWNVLVGADAARIAEAAVRPPPDGSQTPHYGSGDAGERIVSILEREAATAP